MTKKKVISISKILREQMDAIQNLSFMTTDDCDANTAYEFVEQAIDYLLQSTGMSFEEQVRTWTKSFE